MGIPMNIQLTESERNRQGQVASAMTGSFTGSAPRPAVTYGSSFPPLSTGLAIPSGVDTDAHRDASIPYHRLFVTSLAVNLSADDLRQVFEPFGGVDFVDLHMDFVSEPWRTLAEDRAGKVKVQHTYNSKICVQRRWHSML